MSPPALKDQLDYVLKQFLFIADQRMKTFNFYVILLAAVVGGTLSVMDRHASNVSLGICGALHIFLAVIFAMMDQRSRRLIRITRGKMERLESSPEWPLDARVAYQDSDEMRSVMNKIFSFSGAFRTAFAVQTLFGAATIFCAIHIHPYSPPKGGLAHIQTNQVASAVTPTTK